VTPRAAPDSIADRFLSREAVRDLVDRLRRIGPPGAGTIMYVRSSWTGNLRWARNRIISSGDTTDHTIQITRLRDGASAWININRTDDQSLRAAVAMLERWILSKPTSEFLIPERSAESYAATDIWSDATTALDAAARASIQRELAAPVEAVGLLSAGYIEVSASGMGVANSEGMFAYMPGTRAEYSLTVRDPKGTASGWAGLAHRDWRQIDTRQLSAIALEKCRRSANPVAIEPGRYDVILEPQAVADKMEPLFRSLFRRPSEQGMGPWADRPGEGAQNTVVAADTGAAAADPSAAVDQGGRSKIGQRVLDRRITLGADPSDPEMPFVPFYYDGSPNLPVKWIDGGVLKELAYDRWYAVQRLNKPDPLNNMFAYRVSGGDATVEEMIARTDRGLLVTRLDNVRVIDLNTLLCTGNTADGLWLIERGKITKSVKNFRFRESPIFAFNNLAELGAPARVLESQPVLVPPAKVLDFSMTSLADAV
jgi:predicted Zn-dependent protease